MARTGRARSYFISVDPDKGSPLERDCFVCKHCQKIVFITPRCDPADMGGRCYQCDGLICPMCVDKGCTPFEKKLEAEEARYLALKSYGL